MKQYKGFISIYALIIFFFVTSCTFVLMIQIVTYHQSNQKNRLIDLYALRCVRVALSQPNQTYPIYESYMNQNIVIDYVDNVYHVSYCNHELKVVFDQQTIISYEYD